jgi:hypothetical protein
MALPKPLFHVLLRNRGRKQHSCQANRRHCVVLLSLFTWKGKTIHLEDLVVMRGTGLGYALYSEIIKQGKRPSA